jgi:hypothetical protein
MSDSKLYVYEVSAFVWMAIHPASGMGSTGADRDEALKIFRSVWNDRSSLTIVYGPPPAPKRPGEHAPVEAALEQAEHLRRGHATYKRLLHAYHSDKHKGETFTADEITAALIQLWEACR